MDPKDVDWRVIGVVVSVIVLVIIAITFIIPYSKERKKNSSDSHNESDQNDEKIEQNDEANESKVKGSGISYNCNMTKFKITNDILPIPNESIFEDKTITNCIKFYKMLLDKEITKESEVFALKYSKILIQAIVIMKEFRDKYGTEISNKNKLLRELYYDILLGTNEELCGLYSSMCISASKITKTESKIEFCNNVIRNESKICQFISSPSELMNHATEYLNDNSDTNWKGLVTELANMDCKKFRKNANRILSTRCLKDYKDRYYSILGFSRDFYKRYINVFFRDVRFEDSCEVCQVIDMFKSPIIATGTSSIFSKDETLRNWYLPIIISNVSGIVKATDSEDFVKSKVNTNTDYKGFDHADVVPAAVINAILQIFVIKFIANGNDINNEIVKNDLFKFLLATRLNMTFINVLSNVAEEHDFNLHLSDSYHLESA